MDVHDIARTHLARSAEFPPFRRKDRVLQALDECGYGLGHFEGERIVAFLDQGAGGAAFVGYVVTTRVVVGRFGAERPLVELSSLSGAKLDEGFLQSVLKVTTREGKELELPLAKGGVGLSKFLNAVGAKTSGTTAERPPIVPVLVVEEGDPSGLVRLTEVLADPDPRVASLLRLALEEVNGGHLPAEVGLDLAVRTRCFQRFLAVGRGRHRDGWLSPLRYDDLAQLLPPHFDEPTSVRPSAQSLLIDVGKPPEAVPALSMERVEEAVMDRVIDAAVTRTLGEKWAKGIREALDDDDDEAVTHLRLTLQPGPSISELAGIPAPTSDDSLWGRLRSGVSDLLGTPTAGDGRGALSRFQVRALVGGSYRDLAGIKPDRVRAINRYLSGNEPRVLLARILQPGASAEELQAGMDGLAGAVEGRLSRAEFRRFMI